MNPGGLVIIVAAIWLIVQITGGDMLGRLNLL
jgi:hypothetical protein